MSVFWFLMVLFISAHAKVILDQNENIHVSNEISKNGPEINLTTTDSPETNNNAIGNDFGHISTTEEIPKVHVDSEDKSAVPKAPESNDNTIDNDLGHISTTEKIPKVHVDTDDKSAPEKASKTNKSEINDDLGHISTTEEVPKVHVDNGTALILTPYIKDGRIAEARNASRVDPKLLLNFESYSGFLTVNETLKSHLFFWYFPVVDKPVNDTPWILWLQGGPGASSLYGLFNEIGPVTFGNGKLEKNPYTWLTNHSLLFIDNPVGTGYSYTESKDGYALDLETYATHLYTAMKQFVQLFPELQNAPLFIAGESYAGKYVPALAMKIHERKEWPGGHFNLQGLMLGNALVDPEVLSHIASPFQYFGLIDQTQLDTIKPFLDEFQADITNNRSVAARIKWSKIFTCLLFFAHQNHAYNFLTDDFNSDYYAAFLGTSEVKRALHVGDIKFSSVNMTVNWKLAPDFVSNTKPMMEVLLEHYRVLVYCPLMSTAEHRPLRCISSATGPLPPASNETHGQLDQMMSCFSLSRNYRTWKWSGTQEFLRAVRFPYILNSRLAGYHKTGGRLTEVVLRGAGHMAPMDAPAPAQAMVAHWTRDEPISPKLENFENIFLKYFLGNQTVKNI